MKNQKDRQSNGNKSESLALKNTAATTSRHVQREADERVISSDGAAELIRAHAYRLFELRGGQPGHALDDWLQAEREIVRQPASPENRGFTCSC